MNYTTRRGPYSYQLSTGGRTLEQIEHGARVEARQRVNHQPNGYAPISEAELQAQRGIEGTGTRYGNEASGYKPAHGGYSA